MSLLGSSGMVFLQIKEVQMTEKRRQIPRNPWVWKLVEEKRPWSEPGAYDAAEEGFRGWHERGYLPHRDEPGLIQFVTFRLADSFPVHLKAEWEHLLRIEDDLKRRRELESYLDRGRGSCWLRDGRVASLVEDSLRHFHGIRYELRAWVIMPNHGHVLFRLQDVPMGKIIRGWKTWTSKGANQLLQRTGPFWAEDYWDTYMRDEAHE